MARLNTFYLPADQWPNTGETALLRGSEAKHLMAVLRTPVGADVRLIDGQGRSGLFVLEKGSKSEAVLRAERIDDHEPPCSGAVLALGWNKSKRRDWVFEKAVELGALGVVFWRAEYSQGKPPSLPKENWYDKLIQAAKQCGAVHLPKLAVADGLNEIIAATYESCGTFDSRIVAWEKASSDALLGPEHFSGKSLVVIGPEGGLSETETDILLKNDFSAVTLGRSILRWETAAVHALSLAHYARERRG